MRDEIHSIVPISVHTIPQRISNASMLLASTSTLLDDQCDDILYVQGQCTNGAFVRTEATLANACVRN